MLDKPDVTLTIRLPQYLSNELNRAARDLDQTRGELIRRALCSYLSEQTLQATSGAASEELLAHIRELVASAIRRAKTWEEVQGCLAEQDLAYASAGGGLVVTSLPAYNKLCKASQVGPGYSGLIKIFGPFPDHPHKWLADRIAQDEVTDPTSLIDDTDQTIQ